MLTLYYIFLTLSVLNLAESNPLFQRQPRQPCSVQGQPSYHQQPPNPYYQPQHSPPPLNRHQQQCGRCNFNPQAATAYHQTPCQRQQPLPSQQQVPVLQQPLPALQHQSTGCQKPNHQGSVLNNLGLPLNQELGQYLVERLYSNPVFREILSQKQAVTVPIEKTEPKVVNNYFIVPKDLFLNNTECIRELHRSHDVAKGRRRPNDRKVKECIRNNAEKRLATGTVDYPSDVRIVEDACQFNYPEEYNYNREPRMRPAKAIKSNPINNANEVRANNDQIPLVIGSVNKSNKTETKNKNKQHRETQNIAKPKSKDSKVSFLSDEYIFNDFKKKFPHIPDETAKNMIKQMKEQVRKQYSNYVDTNPGPVQYVVRKKSKNSENDRRNHLEDKKQSKNDTTEIVVNNTIETLRKKSNYNRTEVPELGIISSTENSIENKKEIITTPETREIDTTTEGFKYYKPETSDSTTPLTINGHYSARLPELGAEDAMPNIDENDLVGETDFPDYYPDFDNHAYHLEALEEFANDNIQRNGRKADENREIMLNAETHPKPFRRMGRKFWRQRLRNKGNIQKEQLKATEPVPEENLVVLASLVNDSNNAEEEIVFQIPPGLDSPDFRTIQIIAIDDDTESYETDKKPREPYEKFSTYSEIKNGENNKPINEIRKVKVSKPRDVTNSDIETVFARSRVVNYAKPKDLAYEETVTLKSNVLFASDGLFPNTLAADGLSSFIVAKSYDEFGESTR